MQQHANPRPIEPLNSSASVEDHTGISRPDLHAYETRICEMIQKTLITSRTSVGDEGVHLEGHDDGGESRWGVTASLTASRCSPPS